MGNLIRQLILLISMVCFFTACAKNDLPVCNSDNCINVNIKGSLYVKPTGEKLDNIPVEVFFFPKDMGLISFDKKVISGKTDKNGAFNFNVAIDTTLFLNNWLRVRIPQIKNYFTEMWWSGNEEYMWIDFSSYDKEAIQNINFRFYKKAILTINYKRTQTDDLELLLVFLSFDNNPATSYIISNSNSTSAEVTRQYEVAADVYTKILWEKRLKGGERHIEIDSLICRQNNNNVININY